MIYKISLKSIISLVSILLLVITIVYYLFNSGVFADDTYIAGQPEVQIDQMEDIDGDGDDEKITLLTYKVEEDYVFILQINDGLFSKRRLTLENFEIDLRFCNANVINTDSENKLICLVGYVGVHSERVEVIEYKNNRFNKIYFTRDGLKSDNMISDAPNVHVDSIGDKVAEICVDSREYEKDPLLDFLRTCYILNDNNEFEFKSESSQTMREDIVVEGEIQ